MIKPDQKLVNTIINTINWDNVYDPERTFSEDDPSAVTESLPFDITLHTGVTKCVLDLKNQNFVIKLPFLYYCDTEEDVFALEGAPFGGSDYCYAEWQYFIFAHRDKVDMFFPDTVQYCTAPYPIYLQEKCISMLNFPKRPLSIEQKEIIKPFRHILSFSDTWLFSCYKWYGASALYRLASFLTANNISDFHKDNYGYRLSDHSPVLIDFSGFDY